MVTGDEAVEKFPQEAFSFRAVKAVRDQATAVGDDRGKAFGLVPPGDAHVFIGIYGCKLKLAFVSHCQSLQHGCQDPARAAPIGADIEHNRQRMGALKHHFIKGRFFDSMGKLVHAVRRASSGIAWWPLPRR